MTVPIPMPVPMPPPPPMPPSAPDNRDVSNFVIRGSQDVHLGHLDRKSLNLTIPGSGKIRAEGKVENLTLTIFGSGKADLGKLAVAKVSVQVMGSGEAIIAPSGSVKVSITGSGKVRLRSKPATISQSVKGSGQVLEEY